MNSNIPDLIIRYRDKGVLIDTNLLLVLLVGNVDPRLVGRSCRTEEYTRKDYELIRDLLVRFNRLITIPQVLAETGNFLKRNCPTANTMLDLHLELRFFTLIARESRSLSKRIVAHPAFPQLGYTDAAIIHAAARGSHLILTNDGPLQGLASGCGLDVLPFDWLRAG